MVAPSACTCGGSIRWRTNRRAGRLVIRYGACRRCGVSARAVLSVADILERAKRDCLPRFPEEVRESRLNQSFPAGFDEQESDNHSDHETEN